MNLADSILFIATLNLVFISKVEYFIFSLSYINIDLLFSST